MWVWRGGGHCGQHQPTGGRGGQMTRKIETESAFPKSYFINFLLFQKNGIYKSFRFSYIFYTPSIDDICIGSVIKFSKVVLVLNAIPIAWP